jgi:hypothetical protein
MKEYRLIWDGMIAVVAAPPVADSVLTRRGLWDGMTAAVALPLVTDSASPAPGAEGGLGTRKHWSSEVRDLD